MKQQNLGILIHNCFDKHKPYHKYHPNKNLKPKLEDYMQEKVNNTRNFRLK